jgi:hypothetical protein
MSAWAQAGAANKAAARPAMTVSLRMETSIGVVA